MCVFFFFFFFFLDTFRRERSTLDNHVKLEHSLLATQRRAGKAAFRIYKDFSILMVSRGECANRNAIVGIMQQTREFGGAAAGRVCGRYWTSRKEEPGMDLEQRSQIDVAQSLGPGLWTIQGTCGPLVQGERVVEQGQQENFFPVVPENNFFMSSCVAPVKVNAMPPQAAYPQHCKGCGHEDAKERIFSSEEVSYIKITEAGVEENAKTKGFAKGSRTRVYKNVQVKYVFKGLCMNERKTVEVRQILDANLNACSQVMMPKGQRHDVREDVKSVADRISSGKYLVAGKYRVDIEEGDVRKTVLYLDPCAMVISDVSLLIEGDMVNHGKNKVEYCSDFFKSFLRPLPKCLGNKKEETERRDLI